MLFTTLLLLVLALLCFLGAAFRVEIRRVLLLPLGLVFLVLAEIVRLVAPHIH